MNLESINSLSATGAWRIGDEGDGIFRLVLDLPGEKVNKLTSAVLEDLERILEAIARETAVKALIVWGGKEDSGTFIAGADIHEIRAVTSAAEASEKARRGQQILGKLASLPAVTIAAIHGACLGGGTELALACDLRIASHAPKTRIGLPEVQLGILPGFGGTQRLPRLCGLARALPVILGGKPLGVHEAAKIGLLDKVVYPGLLRRESKALAQKALLAGGKRYRTARKNQPFLARTLERFRWGRELIRRAGRKSILKASGRHYPAPFRALDAAVDGFGRSLEDGLALEAALVGELVASPVSKNLMDLFLTSEEARRGKRSAAEAAASPEPRRAAGGSICGARGRIGLVGAGVMGGGIAALLAQKGFRVRMKDISWDALRAGLRKVQETYRELQRKRRMTRREAANCLAAISVTTDYSGFQGVTAVIEAVVESMDVKQKVLRDVEEVVPAAALLASNTSALSISELQSALVWPGRVAGLHFFNPVQKMLLVEVVHGRGTSDEAVEAAEELARELGKVPVRVEDSPGFLVNRLLSPYLNEAVRLLEEGYSPLSIDRAARDFGMPMGPFELLDEVGLDVAGKVALTLEKAFGERARPPELMGRLAEAKLLGKKGGKGFYLYGRGGKPRQRIAFTPRVRVEKRFNGEVLRLLAGGGRTFLPDNEELWVKRLIYPIVNEAALALDERVVEKPSLVDLAMVLGTGFAPFRGGPLRHADAIGVAPIAAFLEGTGELRMRPCQLLSRLAREGSRFYNLEGVSLAVAH